MLLVFDPEIGARANPSSHARRIYPAVADRKTFAFDIYTDDRGARVDGPGQRSPEQVDVMVVGDSFTWGYALANEDTWARHLSRDLEASVSNFAMAAYGTHIGTAFQLIDDVLDYSGHEAETGKHLGDDLAEGKPTLPLIHVIQHGGPQQAALVRSAIENASGDSFAEVLAAVRASGALDAARRHGADEAEMAKAALAPLPDSKFRQTLLQLADFAVQRSF